jgi:gluconokinase
MIGTSGAVRRCVPEPVTDRGVRNWCYNLTDQLWVAGGAINNGGLALDWVKDNLAPGSSYEDLDRAAASVPPGSDGLIFLPFFSGERSPHWNSHARGVLFGLTLNHTRNHIVRAVMEGVAYSLYSVFIRLRQLSAESASSVDLRASGSATRSSVWVQIIADVFGERVTRPGDPEGTAFGAAVLGMIATGRLSGPGAVETLMGPAEATHEPDAGNHVQYQRLFGLYEDVYRNLVGSFDALAAVMRE